MTCRPIGALALSWQLLITRSALAQSLDTQRIAAQQRVDDAKTRIDSMHTDFKQTCRLVHDGHTVRIYALMSGSRSSARRPLSTQASPASSRSIAILPSARPDLPVYEAHILRS